ncbi:Ig-like domain-containing protein [Brevibacillus reuszeri]|uniref:Ig-like domain-containing protein n=1 Tax=Brevibacillus reuszeri TaxID=54915 RepID=UPI0028977E4F|nr:Ig-like domain-containing protein [Brevibacillus reuszeri]
MRTREKNHFSCWRFLIRMVPFSLAVSLCLIGQASAADDKIQLKWEHRYIKEETREMVQKVVSTKDGGGLVWANRTNSDYRILPPLLVKADGTGVEEWSKRMPEEFFIADVEQAKEGGYLVMGALRLEPDKLQLIKLSETGDEEWTKAIEVEGGAMIPDKYALLYSDFAETSDGGVVAVGQKYLEESGKYLYKIVKITASGEIEWDKPLNNSAHRVFVTKSGEMFVQGSVFSGDAHLYVAKLSEEADKLWEHTYEQKGSVRINSVLPATDGGLLVTGYTNRFYSDPSFDDIVAWHIDSEGKVVWQKLYDTEVGNGEVSDGERGISLSETADDGYMLIGVMDSINANPSKWNFKKLDRSGDLLWEKTISFPQIRVANAVPQGNDQYLLLGEYWEKGTTFADKRDIYLIKYGKTKTIVSLEQMQKHKLKLDKGDIEELKVTAVYDDDTEEALTNGIRWTSSNEEIAVVDENGQVTAKQKGKVQIIATYQGKKAVFPVQVKG